VKTLDASSSSVAPQGGAATGGGGLAMRQPAALGAVLMGLLLSMLLLSVGWRRPSY
jgi:hypothetical protein